MIEIRNFSVPGWPRVPRDSGSLKRSGEFSSPQTKNMWSLSLEWNYWKLIMNHSLIKVWASNVENGHIEILSVPAANQLTKKWHVSNNIDHLVALDKIAWPGHVSPGRYLLKIHFFIELGINMIQFKIQFKTRSGIITQKNIHSIEIRIFNLIIHSIKLRKIIQNSKTF